MDYGSVPKECLQCRDGICQPGQLLPLYGALSPVIGAFQPPPARPGSWPPMATGALAFVTTVMRRTNATNSNTNKPNKDHPVPLRLNDYQPGLMAAVLDRDEQGNLVRKAGIMGYRPGCWRSPSWRPDPCRAAAGA